MSEEIDLTIQPIDNKIVCKICGKPRAEKYPFDQNKFCGSINNHGITPEVPFYTFCTSSSNAWGMDATNYVRVSPVDLVKIRMIVREELVRIIEEQELKLEEIFNLPMEKHDGKLGGNATVSIRDQFHDVAIMHFSGMSILGPKQSLSLLAWFRQEESTLEKMAKEQEE